MGLRLVVDISAVRNWGGGVYTTQLPVRRNGVLGWRARENIKTVTARPTVLLKQGGKCKSLGVVHTVSSVVVCVAPALVYVGTLYLVRTALNCSSVASVRTPVGSK